MCGGALCAPQILASDLAPPFAQFPFRRGCDCAPVHLPGGQVRDPELDDGAGPVRRGEFARRRTHVFEGDRTLSVILSKALMLADDTSISDPTITRQIERG